ncbi:hypothetical protein IWX48DRAFT_637905 [Phyllosticta citricarpa]
MLGGIGAGGSPASLEVMQSLAAVARRVCCFGCCRYQQPSADRRSNDNKSSIAPPPPDGRLGAPHGHLAATHLALLAPPPPPLPFLHRPSRLPTPDSRQLIPAGSSPKPFHPSFLSVGQRRPPVARRRPPGPVNAPLKIPISPCPLSGRLTSSFPSRRLSVFSVRVPSLETSRPQQPVVPPVSRTTFLLRRWLWLRSVSRSVSRSGCWSVKALVLVRSISALPTDTLLRSAAEKEHRRGREKFFLFFRDHRSSFARPRVVSCHVGPGSQQQAVNEPHHLAPVVAHHTGPKRR